MQYSKKPYDISVFVNCPFDKEYNPMLRAIIFAIYRCGFVPKCALLEDNGLENRLDKLKGMISACRFGIHDISRTELNENKLPRFNMPFELGLFFGARYYGSSIQKEKNALIFDVQKYRYQQFISDLNGVDIKAHENDPKQAIRKIRDWLQGWEVEKSLPGHQKIISEYDAFCKELSLVANDLGLSLESMPLFEYCMMVEKYNEKYYQSLISSMVSE